MIDFVRKEARVDRAVGFQHVPVLIDRGDLASPALEFRHQRVADAGVVVRDALGEFRSRGDLGHHHMRLRAGSNDLFHDALEILRRRRPAPETFLRSHEHLLRLRSMNEIAAAIDLDAEIRVVIERAVSALRVEIIHSALRQDERITHADVGEGQGKFGGSICRRFRVEQGRSAERESEIESFFFTGYFAVEIVTGPSRPDGSSGESALKKL